MRMYFKRELCFCFLLFEYFVKRLLRLTLSFIVLVHFYKDLLFYYTILTILSFIVRTYMRVCVCVYTICCVYVRFVIRFIGYRFWVSYTFRPIAAI